MSLAFDSVLVANRGEIACRIIRTLRHMGLRSIAVYSEADAGAQHVRQADLAVPIGGPRPQDSYLRIEPIVAAALDNGAGAIHPGYGFLSERPEFAEAVEQAGLVFIGPAAASMRRMGSKAGAKALMAAHGVPVVPGYTGDDQDGRRLAEEADRIGYPLMIKAAYGGGGKGMRIVRAPRDFAEALASCQREAQGAFGNARVLLERYITHPRHIEFQIFGDRHGHVVHLNERECSAQRRYQKVLEETPSPFLSEALRGRMGEAAIVAGKALDYINAGTVEFIVSPQGEFYFMELNARLQVEHPVTEMTLGLDLVELQLRIASGESLPDSLLSGAPAQRGHAIELRLYAEDPSQNFLPCSGTVDHLVLPLPSANVRVDSGVAKGDLVSIHYDPMIAKLIVWDVDRPQACIRLQEALAECHIHGPASNLAFLERLVRHPAVCEARIDAGYLDRALDEFLPANAQDEIAAVAAAVATLLRDEQQACNQHSPWARGDGWRIQGSEPREVALRSGASVFRILARGYAGEYALTLPDGRIMEVRGARCVDDFLSVRLDGRALRLRAHMDRDWIEIHKDGIRHGFDRVVSDSAPVTPDDDASSLHAPMPGRVVVVRTSVGATVESGHVLVVMEAMKMELALRAPRAGTVAAVQVVEGDFVEADAVLVRME